MSKSTLMARLFVFSVVSCLSSHSARAQLVGNYGGQLADGSPVAISVSRFRGQLFVSGFETSVIKTCRAGIDIDETVFYGGFFGQITQSTATASANTGNMYFGLSLNFDNSTRSVSGYAVQEYVRLTPGSGRPVAAIVCGVKNQAFAAVLDAQANFKADVPVTTAP